MMGWIDSLARWIGGFFGGSRSGGNQEQIAAIQAAAVRTCGFLPMAQSVTNIIGQSSNPAVLTATSVAGYICSIVTKTEPLAKPQTLVGTTQQVQTWEAPDGTLIQGSFVGKQ